MSDDTTKAASSRITVDRHGWVTRAKDDGEFACTLHWCNTHDEAVWVYSDGSYGCPYDVIVEARSDDHDIVPPPWVSGSSLGEDTE